jgi:hypothetical protein
MEERNLNLSLAVVKKDAERSFADHQQALKEPPLFGWTVEKHRAYHEKYMNEARAVINYCFIRQMQINPD